MKKPGYGASLSFLVQLLPWLIALAALAARLIPGARTIDDSFITFRYVRYILAGNGFVYNPGEHVLGTTTPLYTILLVITGFFTGGTQAPFPQLALITNAVADAITCLLLYRLGRRLSAPISGLGSAVIWAITPFSVTFAIGGLETSLVVLLLVAVGYAYIAGRRNLTALLAALLLLTRPDALIFLGPLYVDRVYRIITDHDSPASRRQLWIEAAWLIVPLLPWLIFSIFYFGSPLPHSIAAKSLAYRLPPEAALVRLIQHYATPFQENLTFGVPAIVTGMVLYPFLSLLGALHAWRIKPQSWVLTAYPWLYLITFAIANPLIFRWYLTPPLPFYILTILIGLEHILQRSCGAIARRFQTWNQQTYTRYTGVALLVLLPFLLSLRGWTLHPDHGLNHPAPRMAWYQLELLYRDAAESLVSVLGDQPENTLIAAGDVGVIGFYTQARILDTVGLNSPISSSYYPLDPAYYVTNYAIPPDLILDIKPDYVIIMEVYGRNGLLRDPRFWEQYDLLRTIPTDIYGSQGMLILSKKS